MSRSRPESEGQAPVNGEEERSKSWGCGMCMTAICGRWAEVAGSKSWLQETVACERLREVETNEPSFGLHSSPVTRDAPHAGVTGRGRECG